MIYLDNAATGGFKPHAVFESVTSVTKYLTANPGRSGHRLAVTGASLCFNSRKVISEFFSSSIERVIFTKNCTEALNTAIFGALEKGDHVITTVYEHNSVLRPLFRLEKLGEITLDIVSGDNDEDLIRKIKNTICQKTKMICLTAVSNVTGRVFPVKAIGEISKQHGIIFVVDGAQGGGHVPLSIKDDHISALALAGHKGLYGVMGSGLLILDDEICLSPLTYGGTGIDSFNPDQPEFYPERLEAGTLNLPAVASLYEGVKFVNKNLSSFNSHLLSVTAQVIEELKKMDKIDLYSQENPAGIVSFGIKDNDSQDIADILANEFDIAVRGGFHCAPLTHKHLKTDTLGLVRASISPQNTWNEISRFLHAVRKIATRSF